MYGPSLNLVNFFNLLCYVYAIIDEFPLSPYVADGAFSFMDTFEGQAVDLMISEHEAAEEKAELEKQLQEVWYNDGR